MNSLACSKHDSTNASALVSKEYGKFIESVGLMSGLLTFSNYVPRRADHNVTWHISTRNHCAFRRCFAESSCQIRGVEAHGFIDDTVQVLCMLQGCEIGDRVKAIQLFL